MLRVVLVACCVLLFSVCHPATGQSPVDPDALTELIEQSRSAWNVPGLAVAVVKDGQVVLARGFGLRERGKPEPVDADTLFAIASNSKAFTAAALAILQEEGQLNWDDPVQQHLPWLQMYDPWVSAELRIDDLLCHRSGLGTFSGDLLWWGTPYSPKEILQRSKRLTPRGRFRGSYGYSNLMFLAAGEVIREASGKSWAEFVTERILTPVGMSRSITSVSDLESRGNFASPHKPSLTDLRPIPWYNWDSMAAAGGIISSVNDMARWLKVQLAAGRIDDDRRLFSEESSHRMWSPLTIIPVSAAAIKRNSATHFRSYGLGWSLADYKGRRLVAHGGGYDGMYSHVLMVPDENLGVVVLTNSMTGIPSALAHTIVDQYLGGAATNWLSDGLDRDRKDREAFYARITRAVTPTVSGTQPSQPPEACTGTYRCPMYGDCRVDLEPSGLVLRLLPNPDLVADLTHLQYDTWIIRWRKEAAWFAEGTIQFVPDAAGIFQELRLNVPNDDLWFDELQPRRIAADPARSRISQKPPAGFSAEQQSDRLLLTLGERPAGEFVFSDARILRPYFSSLRTPGRLQVTRNHPPVDGVDALDHDTMHPGVWLGFGDLNGQDFWRNKARIEHVSFTESPTTVLNRLHFATQSRLLNADSQPMGLVSSRFTLVPRTAAWLLVWDAEFHADSHDLVFGDQEEMGFGARVATPLTEKNGGRILNSGGLKSAQQTWGQSAAWCDYSGTQGDQSGGILLMASPANFRESWWHNRDYGVFVANPFGRSSMKQGDESQIRVPKGESLRIVFGALIHEGQSVNAAEEYQFFCDLTNRD